MPERPWTLDEVRGYLDRHGIAIVQEGGELSFSRPRWMDTDHFRFLVGEVKPHAKRLKAELIVSLSTEFGEWVAKDMPIDYREVRHAITQNLLALSKLTGFRVAWFSQYDRSTGYLPSDARLFPFYATHGRVVDPCRERDGLPVAMTMPYVGVLTVGGCVESLGTGWEYLPWSSPKLKKSKALGGALVFRTPYGWKPPPYWCKPRLWIPAKPSKKLLAKKWAEKWKHEKPPAGEMPD